MKKFKKIFLALAIIITLALLISFWGKALAVEAITVLPKEVVDTFTEEGIVKQGNPLHITSNVSGNLSKLYVVENSAVEKGTTLAQVDAKDYLYTKSIHLNTITAYQAQIAELKTTEQQDKSEIGFNISQLTQKLKSLQSNKKQAQINKVITPSPDEYVETLKLSLELCESDYSYSKTNFDALKELYDLGTVSKNELELAKSNLLKSESALTKAKTHYTNSQSKLNTLKASGITSNNLNEQFYTSQDETLDATISELAIQIKSLQTKSSNDYSTHSVKRLEALIQNEKVLIQQLENQIKNCTIVSETSGYITDLPIKSLSTIQSGQTLAMIQPKEMFTVSVDVLTSSAPYLKVGDPVTLTQKLKGKNLVFQGNIKDIYNFAKQSASALGLNEHRVEVIIAITDDTPTLKDGYEVDVTFQTFKKPHQLAVPNSSIFKTQDIHYVFKIENKKAILTPVEVLHQTNTETVITSGIAENDQIIMDANLEGLSNGIKVSIKNK